MVVRLLSTVDLRRLESIFLVGLIVIMSIVVVFPLNAPNVKAQVYHLHSAFEEDNNPAYDINPTSNIVQWDPSEEHHIREDPVGPAYVIEPGYTLIIPALDSPTQSVIFDLGADTIEVFGRLETRSDGNPFSKTWIQGSPSWAFEGIYFHNGSEGMITDVLIRDTSKGIVFEPGSKMLSPGISQSVFQDFYDYAVQMDGVTGYTNIANCNFNDNQKSSTAVDIRNGSLNITTCIFTHHSPIRPSLHIKNAKVNADDLYFTSTDQPGNAVHIEENSDDTVFTNCRFDGNVLPGYHYIRIDGSSPFIDNCTFVTSHGEYSVFANETTTGIPAHPIIRNPTAKNNPGFWDNSFDNSSMNVTGGSSITLQWYMNVQVIDPDGNHVQNAPVWVKNRNGDPAQPSSIITDSNGWAKWFVCTELIQYENSVTHFSPFNVSAVNNSMFGYAIPKVAMNMSKEITIIVPFSPIPNTPPIVSWISTPVGIQSGYITIDFMLEDPNSGDDGNMSIFVEYSTDGFFWRTATVGPGSDIDLLSNNVLYQFVWDSSNPLDLIDVYEPTVYIRITPSDRADSGNSSQTGSFIVDNEAPKLLSGPVISVTNTTANIDWTVHEAANASVQYGLDGTLTNMTTGSTGVTSQSVTLTGLQPGRNYSYVLISVDSVGNMFISAILTFETEVHILLYKGWNMISVPPHLPNTNIVTVLAPISGKYDVVQWYDANDPVDPWKHYKVGKPYGNDLMFIMPIMGFWIYMNTDTIFIPDQDVPEPWYSEFVPLVTGWNFVGYPSITTRDIDVALAGVPYDMIKTYDITTDKWLSYDPVSGSGSLTEMELGRGYWIHATADFAWEVNYI